MLEFGIELSTKIEETEFDSKRVFFVADGYLVACFDEKLSELTVTEIAKRKPQYVVFRDSCMENDSAYVNFEQLFKGYSPKTEWIII